MRASTLAQFLVPLIVACALFMQNLDSTVIATALPAIARSLDESPVQLNVAITCYLLSLAVFIPASGWMADGFGARTVFRAAILVFTAGSIGCGFAHSLPEMVIARILQGVGGAMMVPVGRLVVLKSVAKADLVQAMVYLTIPAMIGPIIGPPLGGFIATYSSWRWIFFINVPIGLIGIVLVTFFIDDIKEADLRPFDFRGFVLAGLGLAGLAFGFENVGRGALPTGIVAALLLIGAVCAGLYMRHARHTDHPIIDLALMRIPTYAAATIGGFVFRIGIGALPFLLPLMLQLGFGLTPFASGLITFASAAGAMSMRLTARRIIRALGFRTVLIANSVTASLFMLSYSLFRPQTSHFTIFLALLAGGFFRSLVFTSVNTLSYADVPTAMMSRATSLASMAQQLSLSVGVAIGALLLHLTLVIRGGTSLTAGDFAPAYAVIAVISLLSVFSFLPLSPDAGAEVSGRARESPSRPG